MQNIILHYLLTIYTVSTVAVADIKTDIYELIHPPFLNPLKNSGYYMYHMPQYKNSCILPAVYIYVFHTIIRINSDYFYALRATLIDNLSR
jgi:hypothetical protein